MRNKFFIISLGLIIITILTGAFLKFNQPDAERVKDILSEKEVKRVGLVVNDGEGSPKIFQTDYIEGMTAFSLLSNELRKLKLTLKTKNYDAGIFIEAIGEKENGKDGKYWIYYINGVLPMVAVDKQEIRPGDKIEFKLEKSPF